jgi:post-segregation antitoxin (ccd killing protein)
MILERRNNMAKQKQNTERVSVFLAPEIHQELQQEAEEKGMNVSALIRMIIMERRIKK